MSLVTIDVQNINNIISKLFLHEPHTQGDQSVDFKAYMSNTIIENVGYSQIKVKESKTEDKFLKYEKTIFKTTYKLDLNQIFDKCDTVMYFKQI